VEDAIREAWLIHAFFQVIQAGRRLYKSPGQYLTLGQTVELNKRFIEGYLHYQHEPAVISLRSNIIKYNRLLRDLGLRDHQVERATRAGWRSLGLLFYRLGLLLAWAILALPGVVLHAPVLTAAKIISKQKAKSSSILLLFVIFIPSGSHLRRLPTSTYMITAALAASTVKVAGRDVISTWKVLLSLVFTPILYAFYAFVATFLSYKWGAPSAITWWMPVYVFVGLPFMAVSALKFGEAAMDVFK
jgi:glycerol-3-phosphate O-acyltransferase/dihydroxyacetone phosphate acyltransferase